MGKRTLFYVFNFLILALFVWAAAVDNDREWKTYQKEFKRLEVERLSDALNKAPDDKDAKFALTLAKGQSLAIKQVFANELNRPDRCTTCHQGYDPLANPTLTTPYKEHPYKAAGDDIHKAHVLTKFGCTSCHMGQGLATTVEDAHGFVEGWEEPMLKGAYIQASCVRCHGNFERLKGAEAAAKGRALVKRLGCVGCHSFNGVGGEISVDLGDIADKPTSRVDWAFTDLEPKQRSIKNWIEAHFIKDTMAIVPGDPEGHQCTPKQKCEPVPPSGMPPFFKELSKDDAAAITAYLMGQTSNKVPSNYFVYQAPEAEPKFKTPAEHGRFVFEKFGCAGCHGEGGAQGRRNFNYKANNQTKMDEGVEPTLTKVIGNYTRDELRKKIQNGVPSSAIAKFKEDGPTPPLYMPRWADKIKGAELEDLMTYLFSIAEKQETW